MKKFEMNEGENMFPRLTKLWRVMKITCLFLMVALVQVSASTYAQNTRLTLNKESTSLAALIEEVEKNSEFRFFYDSQQIDLSAEVTVKARRSSIEQILEQVFANSDVSYEIFDRHIILKSKSSDTPGAIIVAGQQQQNSVSGRITDKTGAPLPGVTVVIKGTTQGTITNPNGDYSIPNIPTNATLVFSFVGMRTKEVVVAGRAAINISMEEDLIGIEEVVSIGYGTMRRSDLTGAVVRVDVSKLQELSNLSVGEALRGNVAGLNVGATDLTGVDPEISVRGNNTLAKSEGGGRPLIVLDGAIYRGKLIEINPHDIASVDILKDASSAAIYGSEASNGVMVITTKQGTGNGDKPVVSYRGYYTYSTPSNEKLPMKREEYLEKFNDATWRISRQAPDYILPFPGYNMMSAGFIGTEAAIFGYQEGIDYDWWGNFTSNGHILEQNISVTGLILMRTLQNGLKWG